MANAMGVSIPPLVNEFCGECHAWHMIDTGDQGDPRYGLPPVDVVKKDKPDVWKPRTYCHTCHAYHNEDGRCGGAREAVDWAQKEIG